MKAIILIFLASVISLAYAVDIPLEFDEQAKQQRYQTLLEELRCLVCQNQNLADSHADLAQDLRTQVYNMVNDGQENEEIIDFLVARYGDFVLYKPRLSTSTVLLWFGPFVLLIFSLIIVYRFIRHTRADDVILTEEDRVHAGELLNKGKETG
jgi:cytochrome c-type biogenesis protein CcmH